MDERPRKKHLDASVAHVEAALLARARALGGQVLETPETPAEAPDTEAFQDGMTLMVRSLIAAEFLSLAEELHYALCRTSTRPRSTPSSTRW